MGKSLLVTAIVGGVFWFFALFLSSDSMTEIISVSVLVAAVFGTWRWFPAALRAYRRVATRASGEASIGVIGLVTLLIAEACKRVYAIAYLRLGRPEYLQHAYFTPFFNYLTLVGLALVIGSTTFDGEKPSRTPVALAVVLAALGFMMSSLGNVILSKLPTILGFLVHVVH